MASEVLVTLRTLNASRRFTGMPVAEAVPLLRKHHAALSAATLDDTVIGADGAVWVIFPVSGGVKVKFGDDTVAASATDFHAYADAGGRIEMMASAGQRISLFPV